MTGSQGFWVYQGSPLEHEQLARICEDWAEHFWSLQDVLISLKIPGTVLLYVQTPSGAWLGALLARVLGESAELFYIYVLKGARGKGLAKSLMEGLKSFLVSQTRVEQIFLEVRPSNSAAISLYEGCGFESGGRRKRYYQDGEDALIYTSFLQRG